ncbi:MAG TPA: Asp23/Gls24 family envelope stress response protein [Atribacterota bacterium]|nr:Asp23/Gls24 family envelope stress response protein [Atribacterota bacterium]
MQENETEAKKLKKEVKKKDKDMSLVEKVVKEEELPLQVKENSGKKEKILKNTLGEINISPEVLAAIVSRIVNGISGVAGLFAQSKSGIGTLLGVKEIEEGIKVDLIEGKSLSTYISVIVDYGSVIIDLAKKIQSVVKSEVEEKTGLFVKSIDVNVMGIQMPGKDKESKVKTGNN